MQLLDIGEVARRTGLSPSALRHYEDCGLVAPIGRQGLRRQYDPGVLTQLAIIAICQDANFTLGEIAGLLEPASEWRAMVVEKLLELKERRARLDVAIVGLQHAVDCPHENILSCPHFQAELERALPRR